MYPQHWYGLVETNSVKVSLFSDFSSKMIVWLPLCFHLTVCGSDFRSILVQGYFLLQKRWRRVTVDRVFIWLDKAHYSIVHLWGGRAPGCWIWPPEQDCSISMAKWIYDRLTGYDERQNRYRQVSRNLSMKGSSNLRGSFGVYCLDVFVLTKCNSYSYKGVISIK